MVEPNEQDLPEQKIEQGIQDDQGSAEYIFNNQAEQGSTARSGTYYNARMRNKFMKAQLQQPVLPLVARG